MSLRSAVLLLLIAVPTVVQACPGCIAANEENRNAFLFTTALLTLIPLIIIGFTVRYLQAKAKKQQRSDRADAVVRSAIEPR